VDCVRVYLCCLVLYACVVFVFECVYCVSADCGFAVCVVYGVCVLILQFFEHVV